MRTGIVTGEPVVESSPPFFCFGSSAKVALKRDGNRRKAPFPFLFSFFSQCSLFSYCVWLDVLRYITMIDFTITLIYQNVTIHNVDLEIKQSEKNASYFYATQFATR